MAKSEIKNNIGLIVFNSPEKRNALNPELSSLIREKLKEFASDNNVKALILTGEGKAKQLLMTGEIVESEKALHLGLVDYLSDNVVADALSFAEKLSANSAYSMSLTKELIRNISNMNVQDAVNYCIKLNDISRSSEDFKIGINKFFNKN
jgi:enoyl-CoA hydratase/carnithine racemase